MYKSADNGLSVEARVTGRGQGCGLPHRPTPPHVKSRHALHTMTFGRYGRRLELHHKCFHYTDPQYLIQLCILLESSPLNGFSRKKYYRDDSDVIYRLLIKGESQTKLYCKESLMNYRPLSKVRSTQLARQFQSHAVCGCGFFRVY